MMKNLGTIAFLIFFMQSVYAYIPYPATKYTPHTQSNSSDLQFKDRLIKYIVTKPVPVPPRTFLRRRNQPDLIMRKKIPINRPVPSCVNSVYIKGGVDLQIIGASGPNRLTAKPCYPGLSIKVCGNALYIQNTIPVTCTQNPRPRLRLYLSELQKLVVAGDSCVNACNMDTYCGLSIESCGCGMIFFQGPINLIRVTNTGSGVVCAHQVNSEHLHILATMSGAVRLRGHVGLLLVRAFQDAYVDTRFLCSCDAMVQAADHALVTLKTTGELRAFAEGMSNIYYYITPGHAYKHSLIGGNVFQMGGYE